MKKHILFIIGIILSVNILFAPIKKGTYYEALNETAYYQFKEFKAQKIKEIRAKQFELFLVKLGKLESNNNWKIYNPYGYMGEWQLGEDALRTIGYHDITFSNFKDDPNSFPRKLQKEAVIKLIEYNESYINKHYIHFVGQTINNVYITKAGLLAAAHLGGNGSLGRFLKSNGKVNCKDAYNTSIGDYLQKFSDIYIT